MTIIKIEPSYKKSTIEIEFFKNDDNTWIHVETGWRWGTFYADVDDEELKSIQDHNEYCRSSGKWEEYEISCLSNFEMNDCWDGCWMDYTVWNRNWTDEQRNAVKEEIENADDWFDWLQERGYAPEDCETYIVGEINIEILDKYPWDD